MKNYDIAVIVGSLRKESYNMKVAKALMALAPSSLSLHIINIGGLPMFNEDMEATPPDAWKIFREQIAAADGVLFLTPEYNRSVPGVLKNAIDVGSRPYREHLRFWGESSFASVVGICKCAYDGAARSVYR
jgi:chromate reductase